MAGDIAKTAEFFSFGTNDLTQTTFGISRDDAARFIGEYTAKGIFKADPFVSLDIEGVGELVNIAAERGRAHAPASNSASAANMAAIPPRSPSARRQASTMSPARPPGADRQAGGGPGKSLKKLSLIKLTKVKHC